MIGAFVYLIRTSTRNKIASQVRRLRNPRYALALLFGLGYFWLVFFRRGARDAMSSNALLTDGLATIIPLGLLVIAAWVWLFGSDRSALAFSQAEVSMLFSAPVSRRQLIMYKLARSQTAVLTTSVIWTLLFRRGAAGWERAISFWLLLSILAMHRLGVALVRDSQNEHGMSGIKRSWPLIALFATVATVVGTSFYGARTSLHEASGIGETATVIIAVAKQSPMRWVLYPFHVVLAPLFAKSTTEWLTAAMAAFALLLLHFLWVVQSDTAFEESAVEASAARAKRIDAVRSRGLSGATRITGKNRRRTLPLAATGNPMVAIVWKNYLWLSRTGQLRPFVGLPLFCILMALVFAGRSELAEILVGVTSVAVVIALFFFGPMTMRNDLRTELGRVSNIKTLPLAGRDILFAEIASSASAISIMQYLMLIAGVIAMSSVWDGVAPYSVRVGIVASGWALMLGLNLANFSIHNGLALLFPAWVRVGEGGTNGIESMGQTMLTLVITLSMLAIMSVLPAIAGAFVYFSYVGLPFVAVAGAALVAGGVLALETWFVANALGGALDRLEPMQIS